MGEWKVIEPAVNSCAEFYEIASDFGDPLELFREAISNAYDWGATYISLSIAMERINGRDAMVLELLDDGSGMDRNTLEQNFWALGNSASKTDSEKIGEKGHGTKIYLNSEKVYVRTTKDGHTYESVCDHPLADLSKGQLHSPKTREIDNQYPNGTLIRIEGYNGNETRLFRHEVIKDYIYWFTKLGSFEKEVHPEHTRDFCVKLRGINREESEGFEQLPFGHIFPAENNNADALFTQYEGRASDYFVKRYEFFGIELPNHPYVKFDALIYVEGDEAKRQYNNMIKARADKRTGVYKVSDRYGLYLCKDYIPIQQVNDWIVGFGTGSNSATLLHGFINCQRLKLTANRGTIANTDPAVIAELREVINAKLDEIHEDLYKNNFGILQELKSWDEAERTKKVETAEFNARKDRIRKQKTFSLGSRTYLIPSNEAELYGLLMTLFALHEDKFDFEPLDYNANLGIDILARNKSSNKIADCEFWYVELKYIFDTKLFNHSFSNIRWLVCWDISKELKDGTVLKSKISDEQRKFTIWPIEGGKHSYFLDDAKGDALTRIKVLPLKEFLANELQISFE